MSPICSCGSFLPSNFFNYVKITRALRRGLRGGVPSPRASASLRTSALTALCLTPLTVRNYTVRRSSIHSFLLKSSKSLNEPVLYNLLGASFLRDGLEADLLLPNHDDRMPNLGCLSRFLPGHRNLVLPGGRICPLHLSQELATRSRYPAARAEEARPPPKVSSVRRCDKYEVRVACGE